MYPGKQIVSLHNRRGDNVPNIINKSSHEFGVYKTNKEYYHPLLSMEYINASLDLFTNAVILVFSDNLDLLATKNIVEIYNNVNLNYPTGSLVADKIDYNFETKNFLVSMFGEEMIKMKVVK